MGISARLALFVGTACLSASMAQAASDAAPLSVCLNKDNAPFSFANEGAQAGFDVAVAQAVAAKLGRPLELRWYQKERRSRGSVAVKTSVLVNAGVCQLVGGFPLIQASLERPASGEQTTLPPVDGMPDESRKKPLSGSQLFPSHGYHFAGVTLVLGPRVQGEIRTLDELKPYRIGNRPASPGDLITMAYKQGLLLKNATHVDIQSDPFTELQNGSFDVTIAEMHRFDEYRVKNPQAPLRDAGMALPVGFNLGFVTTAEHADLLRQVNVALETLLQEGELARAASAAGLSFSAARTPYVRTGLGIEKLAE